MVHAATTNFTFTVSSKPSLNTDTMSKRTIKGDNEQNYYAKATSFDAAGTIYVQSRKLDNTVTSNEIDLRSGSLNVVKSASYKSYAPYNVYYYLKARFGASADGNHLTVTGRYTP